MVKNCYVESLVKSFVESDRDRFLLTVKTIIASERQKDKSTLADVLEKILATNNTKVIPKNIPLAKDTGFLLLTMSLPNIGINSIVLPNETLLILTGIFKEHEKADILNKYQLKPTSKVLFVGPPGCGKTICSK